MDLSALRGLALDLNLAAHGVPATVTRPAPNHAPVVTTGIWQTFPVEDFQPYGTQFQRRDPKRILALPRNVLDELPRGSTIVAPERHGGPNKTWLVADLDRLEADHWRAIVTERLT